MSTGSGISGGAANWSSGFLPTDLHRRALPQSGRSDPRRLQPAGRRCASCSAIRSTWSARSTSRRLGTCGDPEIATRIASYEMAYRLQTSAPELMDLKSESKETLAMYGCRSGQAVVRPGLPAGAADDRARRALREHLPRRLGRPLRRGRQL